MQNPVFLISLAKDISRREQLKERFLSYDSFDILQAVDGREMSAKEYFSLVMPSLKLHKRLMSPAEVGCTLSHIKAYEKFLSSDAKNALFIEDDVIGDDSCIKFAFKMAENIPENAVLICGCQDGLPARFSAFGKRLIKAGNFEQISLPTDLAQKDRSLFLVCKHSYSTIFSTAAYVLSRSGAGKLLNLHKKTLSTSDSWDFLLPKCGLEMYFCDIFAHPTDLLSSNINAERDERGYDGVNFSGLLRSAKYILQTRFQAKFYGFERIFKRNLSE